MGRERVHIWAQWLHALSFIATGMVLVLEVVRAVQEIAYRRDRVTIDAAVCRWYEPVSDLPSKQTLANVTVPLWHLLNAAVCAFILWVELPGRWSTYYVGNNIWRGTGQDVGPWHTGALQIFISLPLTATPANVFGGATAQTFRLAAAYAMLGMGFVNIIIGMIWQGKIRTYRFQQFTWCVMGSSAAFAYSIQSGSKTTDCQRTILVGCGYSMLTHDSDWANEYFKRVCGTLAGVHYLKDEDREKMAKRQKKMAALLKGLKRQR